MMPSQLVSVVTDAGSHTAYARAGGQQHEATSTSPELAVRLAAAGVHRLQVVDVHSTDLYITAARGFQILALMLIAYLVACGVNALYEWARYGRRDRK